MVNVYYKHNPSVHGQKVADTEPGFPYTPPYTLLRILTRNNMELYEKTEVDARSRQLAALLHGCNPPQGWPRASTVCHGKYSGMSFALQFAIAYSSTAHTSST